MKKNITKWHLILVLFSFIGLVSCSTTDVATDNPPITTPSGKYVVQLIATANAAKAAEIKKTFVSEGYDNIMISTIAKNGKKIHRVQVGPFATEAASKNMLKKMKQRYHKNQYINNAVVKTIYGK